MSVARSGGHFASLSCIRESLFIPHHLTGSTATAVTTAVEAATAVFVLVRGSALVTSLGDGATSSFDPLLPVTRSFTRRVLAPGGRG